jgi:LmbE family N-acetylglucosaminyl deacetylase
MIQLSLDGAVSGGLKVLCPGSHSDDIDMGCGGTILRLAEQYPDCTFYWVVFSATGIRAS